MKILIVSQHYYPEQFQINEIAPELVRRGHDVTVLCGLPNYPQGKIYDGYKDKSHRNEVIEGVKVVRCREIARGKNPITLMLNYLSFAFWGNRKVKELNDKYDVVLSYQLSPITMAMPAVKYKKMTGTPVLLYCLDLWPESAQAHVLTDKGLLYRYISRLSKRIYQKCDRILVTSRPFIDYLNRKNDIHLDKMGYLPQHASGEFMNMDLSKKENSCTDFMFAGNLGAGQTLDVIVKAAAEIGLSSKYKVHFVGDGSQRIALEKLAAELNISDNIVFHGKQTRADMHKFYSMADVLLITLRGNNAVGTTMPGKLQMYMTTGKPILGAINGATPEVIAEANCGKCVASGDYKGLAELMKHYMNNKEEYADCGENAKKYFLQNFTLEKYINSLESELQQLVNKHI